jgi:hypothetical protein
MNRLRQAYLELEPGLERYLSTGHHDDERGLVATYMLYNPSRRWLLVDFVINTPTIVASVDAGLGGGGRGAGAAGRRVGDGGAGGRRGGGVPGGLGRADAAAAPHHGPAAPPAAAVPHPTRQHPAARRGRPPGNLAADVASTLRAAWSRLVRRHPALGCAAARPGRRGGAAEAAG